MLINKSGPWAWADWGALRDSPAPGKVRILKMGATRLAQVRKSLYLVPGPVSGYCREWGVLVGIHAQIQIPNALLCGDYAG